MANLTIETATSTKSLLPVELSIRDHYGRETQCALHSLPVVMGRDEGADVQLTDPWISHRHCEIGQIGDVLIVRDLDSKNGKRIVELLRSLTKDGKTVLIATHDADVAAIQAAAKSFQFLDDLHRPDFGRARDRSAGTPGCWPAPA